MAKEKFDKAIKVKVADAMRDMREEMDENYIHDVTLDTAQMVPGFMLGCDFFAKAAGLTSAQITALNSFNTNSEWTKAIRTINTKILSTKKVIKYGPTAGLTRLSSVPKFANFIGVYVLNSSASSLELRFYNKQLAPKVDGNNDRKWGPFNTKYRSWVWDEWFAQNGVTSSTGVPAPKGAKQKAAIGRALPFGHDTTVGMLAMQQLKQDFDLDQSLDFAPYSGIFATDVKTLALWGAVLETLKVSWKETMVLDRKTGIRVPVRVVKGTLVAQPKNLSNSQVGDWFNLRKDFLDKLKIYIKKANPVSKSKFFDFKASKSVKESMTKQLAEVVVRDILKKTKKKISNRTVKAKVKKVKKPTPRSSTPVKPNGRGVSTTIMKAVKTKMLTRPQKKKTDDVKEFAKLHVLIQKRLPAEVRRNMGRPALINQTGRFSDSVKLQSLRKTPAGISGFYTYRLNPYATFESAGKRKWPAGYDPKPLITKSIRGLAMQYTEQKIASLRRQ